jgi:hypothetical protein
MPREGYETVQQTLIDRARLRAWQKPRVEEIDRSLPEWARRSNPIVRRHLGAFWKMITPDVGTLVRLFLAQVGLLIASIPIPGLITILMPTVTVSFVLLPAAGVMYAYLLFGIATGAAISLVDERKNNTLPLLLTIPRSMREILYGKVAASMWRQLENLGLIAVAVALFSMPVFIIQYDILFSLKDNPVLMRFAAALALAAALIRLVVEPFMVGAIGAAIGAAIPQRVPAVVATTLLSAAYFAAINLARLLPLDPPVLLVVETILPVMLPIAIALAAFRFAEHSLRRD